MRRVLGSYSRTRWFIYFSVALFCVTAATMIGNGRSATRGGSFQPNHGKKGPVPIPKPRMVMASAIPVNQVPSLVINNVSVAEGNGGTAIFSVSLSTPVDTTVTVQYATSDGTAVTTDYEATAGTLTFDPGDTNIYLAVSVKGDFINEPDETFFVNLFNPVNATITDSEGVGTILNDDAAPRLRIYDTAVTEGNAGTTNARFTVGLSPASRLTVTVQYATADGTALAGSDYQGTNGTLTFNPGETGKTITVLVSGDASSEPSENFFVNLLNATNSPVVDAQGVCTIYTDDPPANDNFADAQLLNGGSGSVDGSNSFATNEPGEVDGSVVVSGSVWYRWQAPSTSDYSFVFTSPPQTCPYGDVYPLRDIYVGSSLNALTAKPSGPFVAGTTYQIRVIGVRQGNPIHFCDPFVGSFTLAWFPAGAPTPTPTPTPTPSAQTPSGSNVTVQANGVEITFALVNTTGTTTIASINPASVGELPNGYFLSATSLGFAISTTAVYGPPVDVCFNLPAVTDPELFANLSVLHQEGGQLIDRTTSHDPNTRKLCARVSSLSPFVLADKVTVAFGAAGYEVTEGDASALVTLIRSGSTANSLRVDYATADNTAKQRTDYTIASGTVTFGPGEILKTFPVLITDDVYPEGDETLSVSLSGAVGALTGASSVTLTIKDNDAASPTYNPLDNARFFVLHHYHDFLSRRPDQGGWDYWIGQIKQCGSDQICIRKKRIDVANAFFFEQEYQQTGAYVYRLYRAAYGNSQPFSNPDTNPNYPGENLKLPSYAVFARDRARVVGGPALVESQMALANAFVQRPEFLAKYPLTMDGLAFVNALLLTIRNDTGADLTPSRSLLTHLLSSSGRGAVLYRLADDDLQTNPVDNREFIDLEYNRAFVFTQYAGFLRRNSDIAGFIFWLGQVNSAPLRDVPKQHAMVCSFITAAEYQLRFSAVVSHTNSECPQ